MYHYILPPAQISPCAVINVHWKSLKEDVFQDTFAKYSVAMEHHII